MAITSQSGVKLEHLTLIQCTESLTSGISQDPLKVASLLLEKGLVAPAQVRSAQLQGKDDHLKASQLVLHMIGKVEMFPEKFEVFLSLLDGLPWLQDVVECVRQKYKENKAGVKSNGDSKVDS